MFRCTENDLSLCQAHNLVLINLLEVKLVEKVQDLTILYVNWISMFACDDDN